LRDFECPRALRAEWFWALALSCIFVALAWAVSAGLTKGFDESIHALLHTSSGFLATPGMQELGRDVTALGGTVVLTFVTLAAAGYLLLERRPGAAALIVASVASGELIQRIVKTYLARSRPAVIAPMPYAELDSWSFPSGHAMMSTIVYLMLARLILHGQTRLSARVYVLVVAITLIAGIGLSRIYLGVHWPTDVIGGWTIGTAWALLCNGFAEVIVARFRRSKPSTMRIGK
jgi:undecaprenyl-diphosphatase